VLEGWQKNEHASDLLIQRAQSDPRYRAWAVYYLGMLADAVSTMSAFMACS